MLNAFDPAVMSPLAAGWPLLAAGWIDGIGPLLVVVFWVIRQVMVGLKEQREVERAREEAAERGEAWPPEDDEPIGEPVLLEEPPVAAGAPKPQQAQPKPAQADLRSEVEEFLRRAANQGAPPAQQKPAQSPKPKPSLDPFDEPVRQRPSAAKPKPAPPIEIELAPEPTPATFRSRELRHLPESQLAEQAAHLGETIGLADDRVEARLHEKFDHRLGKLTDQPTSPKAAVGEPGGPAARIRKALATPGGAREAVILSEILRRPADQL